MLRVLQYPNYFLRNQLHALQNVVVPESHNTKTLCFQPCGSCAIRQLHIRVLATIHFDDQLPCETHEVDYEIPNRLLSSEFVPDQTSSAQTSP